MINDVISIINESRSFDELKNLDVLPEPDYEDGFYFVSYSHKDYKKVLVDIVNLKERGFKIWYDRGLEVGKSWREDVFRKIASFHCKGVIAYISHNFDESDACAREIMVSIKYKKSLLFVMVDQDVDVSKIDYHAIIDYESDISLKEQYIKELPKPSLFEYNIKRETRLLTGTYAVVSKVNDQNIEVADIPTHCFIGKKRVRVRGVGEHAFSNCVNLKEVHLPAGWIEIGVDAFTNCTSLTKILLGEPFKYFGFASFATIHSSFNNCQSLTSIDFLDACVSKRKVALIEVSNSFNNCSGIKEVINNGKAYFTYGCFNGCSGLERVVFNKTKKWFIGAYAYANCLSLKEVVFAKDAQISEVQSGAFMNCSKLETLLLPDSVKTISEYAFYNMSSLKTFHMPSNLKDLSLDAFYKCPHIKSITLPKKTIYVRASKENIFEDVTIESKRITFSYANGVVDAPLLMFFPNLKSLYCLSNALYNFSGLKEITSDRIGYRHFVREE